MRNTENSFGKFPLSPFNNSLVIGAITNSKSDSIKYKTKRMITAYNCEWLV